MRQSLALLTTLGLIGCGSNWTLRKDARPLQIGCYDPLNFYIDVDEDGWGDGSTAPQELCEASASDNLTASNGRDCIDDDATITARIGATCPAGLVADPEGVFYRGHAFLGSEYEEALGSEYVAVLAPTNVVRFTEANTACEAWGGLKQGTEETDSVSLGKLATFRTAAELAQLQNEVEAAVADQTHRIWAGFIGLTWTGTLSDGSWTWADGETTDLSDLNLTWCTDDLSAYGPEDFFPHLNPEAHEDTLNAALPHIRPALVLTENNSWCLGLPRDAVPASVQAEIPEEVWEGIGPTPIDTDTDSQDSDRPDDWRDWEAEDAAMYYTTTSAHFVCERPKPNSEDYQEFVPQSESDAAEESSE